MRSASSTDSTLLPNINKDNILQKREVFKSSSDDYSVLCLFHGLDSVYFWKSQWGSYSICWRIHHSTALCQCRWAGAGGQKMSSFTGQSSFCEATIRFFRRSPAPTELPSSWIFCGVMGSMAGLCSKEKPNWSVFSIGAKSCHHNKVRPWSCCCDPTKRTTERFMQVHRRTKQTSLSLHFALAVSTFFLSLFPPTPPPWCLLCGFCEQQQVQVFSHLSWLTTQSLCL